MANNKCSTGLLCVIRKEVPKLRLKKNWCKYRISYYSNLNASFNFLALLIQISGDVHPLPGPASVENERIGVRSTIHRHRQKPTCRRHDLSNCIEINSNGVNCQQWRHSSHYIPVRICNRPSTSHRSRTRVQSNLVQIRCVKNSAGFKNVDVCLRLSHLNARSVNNKAMIIKYFTVDNDIDTLALTETWLHESDYDAVELGTLCPTGYRFLHNPRLHARGGGVGLLFKNSLDINTTLYETYKTFELMDVRLKSHVHLRVFVIYRPPESNYTLFYEEFSRLLERVLAEHSGHILFTGDFNFHVDDLSDRHAKRFAGILAAFDLEQHVKGKTHKNGHTLDLAITRSDDSIIKELCVQDPVISITMLFIVIYCYRNLSIEKK